MSGVGCCCSCAGAPVQAAPTPAPAPAPDPESAPEPIATTPVQQAPVEQAPEPAPIADATSGAEQVAPEPEPAPAPAPEPAPAPQQDDSAAAKLPESGDVAGIDVSNWQGDIDWPKVRQEGVRVAYLKATEHTGFTDKKFAENRKEAKDAGVVPGAYHFARPGRDGGSIEADAKAEAEHFLSVASPKQGELVPVLDLEANDGLDRGELARWVKTWCDHVAEATGTKPMIYTSPSFWKSNVDDNLGIADKYPLWIAHWGVDSPDVPGSWDAWRGWQQTSSGAVDGIKGRVDRDRFSDPAKLVV